ncbi:MAG: hypothetical protein ABW096_14195 [Candidatus Thiodiazotropha sp.]
MGIETLFARIACLTQDGRDRFLSQKKPGWNYLLMPKEITDFSPSGDLIWPDLLCTLVTFQSTHTSEH